MIAPVNLTNEACGRLRIFARWGPPDFLEQQPYAHVLVLTSETMRRIVDIDDPSRSPLFGDAESGFISF